MSCEGTWADAIIIQGVASALNLRICIAESNATFSPITIIDPVNVLGESLPIFIGHIGETHYVSTVAEICASSEKRTQSEIDGSSGCYESGLRDNAVSNNIHFKRKRNSYMGQYNKRKRLTHDPIQKKKVSETMSGDKAVSNDIELKSKGNGYMRRCKRGKRLDQLANEKRKTNEMISGDKAVSNDIHLGSKRNGYMR